MSPRRSAAAAAPVAEPKNIVPDFELVKAYINGQLAPEEDPVAVDMRAKIDAFEYNNSILDSSIREITKINVYRLSPEIINQGPPFNQRTKQPTSSIDIVPASEFNMEYVRDKIGGGKLMFWFKSKLERVEYKTEGEYPWPPRIYPQHKLVHPEDAKFCVMVDADNKPLQPPAPPPPPQPITKEDMGPLVREVAAAAKVGNDANAEIVRANTELVMTTARKSIEMMAETLGGGHRNDPVVESLAAQVTELKGLIVSERERRMEEKIERLEARLEERNSAPPVSAAPSALDSLSGAAKVLNVEDGAIGLVKAISGVDTKQEGFFDHVGRGLGEGAGAFVRDFGGRLVELGFTYLDVRRYEAETAAGGRPPSPRPVPAQNRPTPQQLQPQPQSQPQPKTQPQSQEDVVLAITRDISETIVHFLELNFDGAAVAEIVKRQFSSAIVFGLPAMAFIEKMDIFQDFSKLLQWCRQNEYLSPYMVDEHGKEDPAFEAFAREFFNAFQPQEPAPGAPAQTGVVQ